MSRAKYTAELKIKIAESYLAGEGSYGELRAHYGASEKSIQIWVQKYREYGRGAFVRKAGNAQYSKGFKMMCVETVLRGEDNVDGVVAKYNISDRRVLRRWIERYNANKELRDYEPKREVYMANARRKTTQNERKEIAEYCIAHDKDYKGTAALYDVSYSQVYAWVKKYLAAGENGLADKRGHHKSDDEVDELERLRKENLRLRRKLEEQSMVKPRPDDGYEVDKITVTDKDGKPVEMTVKPDGTYTFKQPSGKVTIEMSYKPVDTPWNNPFADVSENNWYYEAMRFVQERGLMNGIGNGNFSPNAQLSRAQLAQILFNKEGRPGVNHLLTFPDVASEAWYTEAVRWATSQGIVGGDGDSTFGPNDPITREQLAVMLWRYSGSPAATNKELHFNDTDEISGFALDAIRWAVENGILNGYGDGRLGPQGQATRAQVAQMLKNFIENQEETT